MDGLIQKYNITKADGSAVDKNARYFVLRVDDCKEEDDKITLAHRKACKKALGMYMYEMRSILPELVDDLRYIWHIHECDYYNLLTTLNERAIDMFFATTNYKPYSADDARALVQNRIGSKEKAEKELGFHYKYSLIDGLQKLIDWRIETGLDKIK